MQGGWSLAMGDQRTGSGRLTLTRESLVEVFCVLMDLVCLVDLTSLAGICPSMIS